MLFRASMILLASSWMAGCAVDPSGLGPPGTDGVDGDGGLRDAARDEDTGPPGDAFLPPRDMQEVQVDMFVPPPDMCVAAAEVCNGRDDDCNGAIDDGLLSSACDGDGDGCMDGRSGCSGGTTTCDDAPPQAGDDCDGPDADTVAEGTLGCTGMALTCSGDCVAAAETCDRSDEDCDGQVDEGGVCDSAGTTCTSEVYGDSVYLFCVEGDGGDNWTDARNECQDQGYELVQIDTVAEHTFLAGEAGSSSWWTGAWVDSNDGDTRRDQSAWEWSPSGDSVATTLWSTDEPSGNGSCGQLQGDPAHRLDDRNCGDKLPFICEAPIAP